MTELTDVDQSIKSLLLEKIRSVKDFSKNGVVFKNFISLLNDSYLLKRTFLSHTKQLWSKNSHLAGLENGGLLFETNLVLDLYVRFNPIRKPGILPAEMEEEVVGYSFEMEIGVIDGNAKLQDSSSCYSLITV